MEQQGSSFLLDPWYNHVWWNHCGHICWNLPSFRICFKRLNLSVFKGHDYFSSPSLVPGTVTLYQSNILDPPGPECCSQLLSPCACLVGQPLPTAFIYIREFETKCLHLSLGWGENRHGSSWSGCLIFTTDALEDAPFCHCSGFFVLYVAPVTLEKKAGKQCGERDGEARVCGGRGSCSWQRYCWRKCKERVKENNAQIAVWSVSRLNHFFSSSWLKFLTASSCRYSLPSKPNIFPLLSPTCPQIK